MLRNIIKAIFVIAVPLIIIFMIQGCDLKVISMGNQQEIFVVADSSLWEDVGPDINDIFAAPIYTPVSEPSFLVRWIPLDKLNKYKDRMNIFLLGVKQSDKPVSQYLETILPAEFKAGIEDGSVFYLFNNDLYASGQIGLILFAKDTKTFIQKFNQYKQQIYNSFSEKYFNRLSKIMFDKGEQKDLEKFILDKYGWKIRVQHDYFIALQDIEKKYVWFRRTDPDRWLSIWEMEGDSSDLTLDKLIAERNKVLGKYYGGDQVYRDKTYLTNVQFVGHPAKKLIGVWLNDSLRVGGPFRMYAFTDSSKSKNYYVDLAVMAPNKQKKPYIDQLEVIANTFRIANTKK